MGIALSATAAAQDGAALPVMGESGSSPPADLFFPASFCEFVARLTFENIGGFILFSVKVFALLAEGPCIPFTGKWYLSGCYPETPTWF